MSDKNQIVVVLIVALFLGAFVDRATALKIVSGVVLLWSLQNQPAIIECVRKLFSHLARRTYRSRVPRRPAQQSQGCVGLF